MKTLFHLLVLGFIAGITAPGCATGDYAQAKDIEELRREIHALRAEVRQIKQAAVISEPRGIELPQAATKAPPEANLVIAVRKDGRILLAGETISKEKLQDELLKLAAKDPQARIVVQADDGVAHQRLVEVLDLAKSAGIQNLAIATPK
jgi:biopolymer transport protein ExbD